MAELQLLTALLTMHKSIGDILEAAQQEGGTIDVFEMGVPPHPAASDATRRLGRG